MSLAGRSVLLLTRSMNDRSEMDYGNEEWTIALVVDVTASSTGMTIRADSMSV